MSARALVVTVTVGFVPPPAVIGAVHTLSSVLSEALKPLTFVYVLPAESVTPDALGLPAPHTPTCTTSRLPVVMLAVGASARLVATARLLTCWTNSGTPGVAAGAGRAMAASTAAARSSAGTAHRSLTCRGARPPLGVEASPAVSEITPSNVSWHMVLSSGARARPPGSRHGTAVRPALDVVRRRRWQLDAAKDAFERLYPGA